MKAVKININKLGAVRDSEIEISPLTVFSGESGLGKSYVAFLAHYVFVLLLSRWDDNRLVRFFTDNGYNFSNILKDKKPGDVFLSISTKEFFSWINKDAVVYIGYLIGRTDLQGDVNIEFPYYRDKFNFILQQELSGMDNHEDLFYRIELDDFNYRVLANKSYELSCEPFAELIRSVLLEDVLGEFRKHRETFILPPSRGALMELSERPDFKSGMYQEFFNLKKRLNSPLDLPLKISPVVNSCLLDINDGNLQQVGGNLMYYTSKGAEMPLTAAASSIKELAPLTLMFNKFAADSLFVLFEEPEAHLHPQRQIRVADMIGCSVNMGTHMQVTTHSDYFIKRLNNLMKLYHLMTLISQDVFEELLKKWRIRKECLINPKQVGAYYLTANGDGTSRIVKLDIEADMEIPFDSFYKTIEDDMELSREIRHLYGN